MKLYSWYCVIGNHKFCSHLRFKLTKVVNELITLITGNLCDSYIRGFATFPHRAWLDGAPRIEFYLSENLRSIEEIVLVTKFEERRVIGGTFGYWGSELSIAKEDLDNILEVRDYSKSLKWLKELKTLLNALIFKVNTLTFFGKTFSVEW